MKRLLVAGVLVLIILAVNFPGHLAFAARGVPGSPDFGYGAWLHLDGEEFDRGRKTIDDLNLDWVAVHLDWTRVMPSITSAPDLSRLDQVVSTCVSSGCAVMLSLTNPPDWAMNADGPDAELSAQFIDWLANRYPSGFQAVEIYPAANTTAGWKAPPNPTAYARLLEHVGQRIENSGRKIMLVAGGLQPVDDNRVGDWSDVDFLRGLYKAGARDWLSILSLRYQTLVGEVLHSPTNGEIFTLRRYETIRQVMIENNHSTGIVWITLINVPGGTINSQDRSNPERQKQAEWLQKALTQVRSHLYMGVVFIHNINPPIATGSTFTPDALILPEASYHPFYYALKASIHQTKPSQEPDRPGRPKSYLLIKYPLKS